MCLTVTPTSLRAGETNDIQVCCDSHVGIPRGTWALEGDAGAISGGTFPPRTIVPGVISRDIVIDPDSIPPPKPGGDAPGAPYGFCVDFQVVVPVTATLFLIRGTCYDVHTGAFICTELKVIPVYLEAGPAGGPSAPNNPNARIPEPFRREEATPEVANDPSAWI